MKIETIGKSPMDERSQLFSKWTTEFVRQNEDMFNLFCSRAKRDYSLARSSRTDNGPCVWFSMGLSYIMVWEYGYDIPPRILDGAQSEFYSFWSDESKAKYPTTVEGLKAEIEAEISNTRQEAIEEYDYAPEDYQQGRNPHEDHPWGEDCVALLQAWCQLDEFEWFMIYRNVKEATESAISENLWEMTMWGDDATAAPLAQTARETLKNEMGKFIKSVTEVADG